MVAKPPLIRYRLAMFLIDRPYVTIFLLTFLCLATRRWGLGRTMLWMMVGYAIALASEACSIRTGFPYGWYFYKYANLTRDPLVFGVPIWDSMSYTFLIYAGYSVAQYWFPLAGDRLQAFVGGVLTMLLDVVIDPVAHLGDRWFLGDIYYYKNPGWYFGVPLSNFLGWFLVSWLVIRANQILCPSPAAARRPLPSGERNGEGISPASPSILDIGFYFGILLFNVAVTWYVRANALTLSSLGLCCALGFFHFKKTRQKIEIER